MSDSLWTIGHSNHTIETFLAILEAHEIRTLVDVRRWPRSRKHPHFNDDALSDTLRGAGIGYVHIEALGGRRKPAPDSINTAWEVEGFRGYADYLATAEFQEALARLVDVARSSRTAIMCAEAVPWRCHRRIIADVLTARGWAVFDVLSEREARPHTLPDFAHVDQSGVTYPGETLFTDG